MLYRDTLYEGKFKEEKSQSAAGRTAAAAPV
jgi:hypothetical protein